ncbi:MAG TPA: terminase family protein [Hanamia sp.]
MICEPTKVVILKNKPPLLTGPLFTKLEVCEKRIIIVQGGGDAAKTSTILQWLAVKCIQTDNIQATVVGMSGPNLKRGAIRLFKKYVAIDQQISPFLKTWNKTDKEQYFANGSILSFVSFEDDEEKARGAENDYVFINEANLLSYNLFWQLQRKCRKKILLDYNPTFAFWAHAKLKNGGEKQFIGKVQMYIVDHRHNPFLTDDEHQAYEDISDPEMFKVYARGETGQTKGVIFKFKKVDKIPTKLVVDEKGNIIHVELDFGFGIDIGYTTDKTAIIKAWTNAKDHYYKELLYKSNDEIQNEINENNLSDETGKPQTIEGYIKKILVENGMTTNTMVWGDHDKNMSSKLRRVGVPYRMAKKGPNSVTASISSVKRFNGHYIDSPNLEEELKTYIFETVIDILTGNEVTTGEPVDGMPDHLISAIRYFEHSYAMRFAG